MIAPRYQNRMKNDGPRICGFHKSGSCKASVSTLLSICLEVTHSPNRAAWSRNIGRLSTLEKHAGTKMLQKVLAVKE